MSQKNYSYGPINMAPSKQNKRQSGERTHELNNINMNHTHYELYFQLLFSSYGFFFSHCTVGFVMLLLNSSLRRTSPKSHKLFAWSYDAYVVGLSYYTFGT
jgi:hypothetical protein